MAATVELTINVMDAALQVLFIELLRLESIKNNLIQAVQL